VDDDLTFALRLADVADGITGPRAAAGDFTVRRKADGSEVTTADVEVEETLRDAVGRDRPGDGFLGEEVGFRPPVRSTRTWIVDGIDGTAAFVAGGRSWGTLVALRDEAEVVIGVVTSPGLRRRWWASRGAGAWMSGPDTAVARRMTVSDRSARAPRTAVLPGPGLLTGWREQAVRLLADALPPAEVPGHGPLLVAGGSAEASVHLWGGPWDHAAFVVIVEEAGGRFTDLWGGRRIDTATAIFSNGRVHGPVEALARRHAPEDPESPW
jgi:histidinol-phosphatase